MGKLSVNHSFLAPKNISSENYVSQYKRYLVMYIANGRPAMDTLKTYAWNIDLFLRWCDAQKLQPLAIDDFEMRQYREALMANGYGQETVALKITSVRAFYTVAQHLGLIEQNPCENVSTSRKDYFDEQFYYFSMEEVREICQAFQDEPDDFVRTRNIAILYLMAIEGLRNVEIHRANVEDINWEHGGYMRIHGKGHDSNIYPSDDTMHILAEYLDDARRIGPQAKKDGGRTPLFLSNSHRNYGGRLSRNGIRSIMNKILSVTQLKRKGVSCHVFRHTCGTILYQQTKDLRIVQETLRQRDPKVTARYSHVSERITNRATSKLSSMMNAPIGYPEQP